jgi:hypothetical protein
MSLVRPLKFAIATLLVAAGTMTMPAYAFNPQPDPPARIKAQAVTNPVQAAPLQFRFVPGRSALGR